MTIIHEVRRYDAEYALAYKSEMRNKLGLIGVDLPDDSDLVLLCWSCRCLDLLLLIRSLRCLQPWSLHVLISHALSACSAEYLMIQMLST